MRVDEGWPRAVQGELQRLDVQMAKQGWFTGTSALTRIVIALASG